VLAKDREFSRELARVNEDQGSAILDSFHKSKAYAHLKQRQGLAISRLQRIKEKF